MQGLKILIGVMTLLIVLGLCGLGYGFAVKFDRPAAESALSLPANAIILDMSGGDKFIALHVTSGKQRHIYIVDNSTGKVRNRIAIEKEKIEKQK